MILGAPGLLDFYKTGHGPQYPDNTELVFSNLTPRATYIPEIRQVILWGLQYYSQEYLVTKWREDFFSQPRDRVADAYSRRMTSVGLPMSVKHLEELHEYGRLPINILGIPEGARVPLGVPMLLMWNSDKRFGWLTNYLESNLSNVLWQGCTAATIADRYHRKLEQVALESGGDPGFIDFQAHDFSYRGLPCTEAAWLVGSAHLLSFKGTDNVPCLDFIDKYYHGETYTGIIAGTVPATEHSVMCMGGEARELDTIRRLLKMYPTGVISIVCDTWDYWHVLTNILPQLKDEIMAREGKLVIRPDSGDPQKIVCGDREAGFVSPERLGTYNLLWGIFGGETNSLGYRKLDSHIGCIYGDSITYERCEAICADLMLQKFVPDLVFGVGSYTYQYVTRDTFGFAVKATYGEVAGEPREIFKNPKTDSGTKKSARGLLAVNLKVNLDTGRKEYALTQQATWEQVHNSDMVPYILDGSRKETIVQTFGTARMQVATGRANI